MKENLLINHFIKYNRQCGSLIKLFPPVICNDGEFLSVQASESHHCNPMETLEKSQFSDYNSVEIYTSLEDDLLKRYAIDFEHEYHFVPIDIVNTIIEKHGGINDKAVEEYINNNKERR